MITRSANKKDSLTESDTVGLEEPQKSNEEDASKNSNEKNADFSIKNFSSPTFNIHIHIPYHNEKNTKIFLPKIQPIIHLHFDEIAKRLEATMKEQNDKSLSKTLENWLSKASPKFENVQFHFKNSSEEKNNENNGMSNDVPCSSHTLSNDTESNKNSCFNSAHNQGMVSEGLESLSTESNNNRTAKSNYKNEHNSQNLSNYKLDGNIKLKNAVVVLTDICKTKNYKKILAGNESAESHVNENDSLCDLDDKRKRTCEDKQECDNIFIKSEKESYIIESCTPDLCESNSNIIDNCTVNNIAILPTEKDKNKSPLEKISRKDQNLTSLVEGWNFSDILNRFQIKHHEHLRDFANYPNCTTQDVLSNELNSNKKKEGEESLQEGVQEDPCSGSESYTNGSEKAFMGDTCLSENKSDGAESPSLLHIKSETENIFSSNLEIGESRVYDFINASKELKTEFPENEYCDSDSSADECENTSGKQVNSEAFLDLELVEPDLSSNKSNIVYDNMLEEEEAINNSFLSNPEFHLVLIEKEMQRRAVKTPASKSKNTISKASKNLKSNPTSEDESAKSDSTPSRKKMKKSNKERENSRQKKSNSAATEDYILLNSFGPTQFAVASLDKVTPFKEHEAHNFKRNMLFSNRVRRFSAPNELRVHQLKRDAARKMLNKKGKDV